MAYLTVADYRTYMAALTAGAPTYSDPGDTTFHQQLLDSATTFIERETRRKFSAVSATRKFGPECVSFTDPQLLMVDEDLLTVTTLTNGNGTTIASNAYELWPRNGSPYFGIRVKSSSAWAFSDDDATVSVAGTWGFMASPDTDVKRVTARLAYLEQQRRTNTGEVMVMQGAMEYTARVPDDIAHWLAGMRRRRL